MAFRARKSFKIAPGVRLTASKSGLSASVGPRGLTHSVGPGGRRTNVGLPGTGLGYSHKHGKGQAGRRVEAAPPPPAARDPLALSLLDKLFKPADEKAFVRSLQSFRDENPATAVEHLSLADQQHADVAYLRAFGALMQKDAEAAIPALEQAIGLDGLGSKLAAYGFAGAFKVPVTDELTIEAGPDEASIRFLLVELYQGSDSPSDARRHADALVALDPDRPAAVISFAELILDDEAPAQEDLHHVAELCASQENDDAVSTILFLYRARALAALGMDDAAIEVLTAAGRRKKDRSASLLNQIAYDRAVLLERTGKKARARKEFEKVYAADPSFADVADRLLNA